MMENPRQPEWTHKPLAEMTLNEWEQLCDGCGICCLFKLEDADTGEIFYTNVACKLLDDQTCRCMDYEHRFQLAPGCVQLTPQNVYEYNWLPDTCAYRRLALNKVLPWWHPLVSENPYVIHDVDVSVRGRIVSESEVDMKALELYVVDWINQSLG